MNVREKIHPNDKCSSSKFNTHALSEVICYWEADSDSMFIKDLDVYITAGVFNGFCSMAIGWKDMHQAFKDYDIITDNYNTCFFEPKNKEDKERGFTLS